MSESTEKGPMPPGISPAPWRKSALRIGTSGFFYEILDANSEPICGLKTRRDRGDAGANARLISASPLGYDLASEILLALDPRSGREVSDVTRREMEPICRLAAEFMAKVEGGDATCK